MKYNLSQREKQILHLIAYEHTSAEIAEKLFISCHTVRSHRKNLLSKLSVKNIAGLIRRGFELGIFRVESAGEIQEYTNTTIPTSEISAAYSQPKVGEATTRSIQIKSIRPSLRKAALA